MGLGSDKPINVGTTGHIDYGTDTRGGTGIRMLPCVTIEIKNYAKSVYEIPANILKPDVQYGPRRKRGKGKYHRT